MSCCCVLLLLKSRTLPLSVSFILPPPRPHTGPHAGRAHPVSAGAGGAAPGGARGHGRHAGAAAHHRGADGGGGAGAVELQVLRVRGHTRTPHIPCSTSGSHGHRAGCYRHFQPTLAKRNSQCSGWAKYPSRYRGEAPAQFSSLDARTTRRFVHTVVISRARMRTYTSCAPYGHLAGTCTTIILTPRAPCSFTPFPSVMRPDPTLCLVPALLPPAA